MCVTGNCAGFAVHHSLLSYAAPLNDETLASSSEKSKRLMFNKEIIRLYMHLKGIHIIPYLEEFSL